MTLIQGTLYDERFLGKYAGAIMSDSTTALVELVANSWDAYATKVEIVWPDQKNGLPFAISDNGIGMTHAEVISRWSKLDYNRLTVQGDEVLPPNDLQGSPTRIAYGRNGRGRHAAFFFGESYTLTTWRDGQENTYVVKQGADNPVELERIESKPVPPHAHGTAIRAKVAIGASMKPSEIRAILSTRFLLDPTFSVSVDSILVSFEDVPQQAIEEINLPLESGVVNIKMIESQKADRTTKQHGIAWWVKRRLVGTPSWRAYNEKFIDGRREEAKRYSFIVTADQLADAVNPDWQDFLKNSYKVQAVQDAVHSKIHETIAQLFKNKKDDTRAIIARKFERKIVSLPVLSQERWTGMLDELVDNCPTLTDTQLNQVMDTLAKLELAKSQYSLLEKFHNFSPADFDDWNTLLEDWSTRSAKIALDEIRSRLQLIEEIRVKSSEKTTSEVQELQPLIGKALWIFGPQFESIEFTSNVGMTRVIRDMFGATNDTGSRNRPDFLVRPSGSIGLYSLPAYDKEFNECGTTDLMVVELKKPGVPIGGEEKSQAYKYIKELLNKGYVDENTRVNAFILGDTIARGENNERKEGDRVSIRPMLYNTFIGQAEKRMMNLHLKLADTPFIKNDVKTLFDHQESTDASIETT